MDRCADNLNVSEVLTRAVARGKAEESGQVIDEGLFIEMGQRGPTIGKILDFISSPWLMAILVTLNIPLCFGDLPRHALVRKLPLVQRHLRRRLDRKRIPNQL